jgi:predicted phosphodiesterase
VRLITRVVKSDLGEVWNLWPLGDFHLGSANCDTDLLDEAIRNVREDDHALWVGMGDMIEAIAPNDKRWDAGGIDEKIVNLASQDRIGDVFVEKLASRLAPIADKLVSYLDGNHERTFAKHYYTNLSERVLAAIGRTETYAATGAYVRIVFEDRNNHRCPVRLFQAHGYQAGRKDGAAINGLDDLMAVHRDCDIVLVGHSHKRLINTRTWLGTNPSFTKLKAGRCFGAHTSSFLRTYEIDQSSYAEVKLYPPTSLGPIRFSIEHRMDGAKIEAIQ